MNLQVVSAISYLHNLNLMHRDIKPENVMFTHPVEAFEAEGKPLRVKVIDMGMSALYSPSKVRLSRPCASVIGLRDARLVAGCGMYPNV